MAYVINPQQTAKSAITISSPVNNNYFTKNGHINGDTSSPNKQIQTNLLDSEQRAVLLLWQRVNASLTAFYKLTKQFGSAQSALQQSSEQWTQLKIHAKHVTRHANANADSDNEFIDKVTAQLTKKNFSILFADQTGYPAQLTQLFDPPPLLFYRGNKDRLNDAQIAIVGSRKPTSKAQKFTFDMAQYLAQAGFVITSGLAQGVDAQAHLGALAQTGNDMGRTVGVMGTGINVNYPKQHSALFERIISEGGCVISELLPDTPPNKHTFPRRNRIVAGLSIGTIVTEAALKSGSLITANLTSNQGKQVFALPSSIDNPNAEGCHHLIREGATLIYHPDQVIEALSSQVISPHMRQTLRRSYLQDQSLPQSLSQPQPQSTSPQTDRSSAQSLGSIPTPTTKNQQNNVSSNEAIRTNTSPTANTSPTINKAPAPILNNVSTVDIPDNLQPLWVHMNWEGQDLDALVSKTKLDTPTLLSQLMALELMGAIKQVGGRYLRV